MMRTVCLVIEPFLLLLLKEFLAATEAERPVPGGRNKDTKNKE
jgi:hypothetical protein